MMKKLFKTIISGIYDACLIWKDEMRQTFKDEGVLIFFILVPLGYPLLYSWISECSADTPLTAIAPARHRLAMRTWPSQMMASLAVLAGSWK